MRFTERELAYLRSQPLARFATVSGEGQPDVVPLSFEVGEDCLWVGGVGASVLRTRKFQNILSGNELVALVVDDLVSLDPFVVRSVRIYGRAEPPAERVGQFGPGVYSRVTPTVSWSWNLDGEPAPGDTWYPARRTTH